MMKKTLFALSLVCSSLVAEGMTPQDPCCCPCEPCCEPKPKKCIDCECYSPPFYDLQCDWGVFATVDFLYWFAKETGLTYALKTETVPSFTQTGGDISSSSKLQVVPRKYKSMDEQWDPGFRVGLGLNGDCDGWDLYAHWTYFHTCNKRSTSVEDSIFGAINFPLGKSLMSPWFNPGNSSFGKTESQVSNDIHFFTKIKAKWRLNYNVIDLEMGRKYWLSQCMSMRPFMGIRGAWTRIHFSTTPSFDSVGLSEGKPILNEASYKVRFKNRFWGVGLLGGFQPDWHFGCGFSLFGNVDFALLWGDFDIKRKENTNVFLTNQQGDFALITDDLGTSKNAFSAMQAILDLGIGLRWESNFCQDRYHLGLDLGWEHHIWFDHNHRFQLRGSFESDDTIIDEIFGLSFQHFDETYGDLVLGGLTARLRFDF